MKKLFVILMLILPLAFAGCSEDVQEETVTEATTEEITTEALVSMDEMSPASMSPETGTKLITKVSDINFSAMEEIEAKDSLLPKTGHDKIYKGENVQYFFVENDIKIHAVFCDDNGVITATASYNTETGYIEFYGDSEISWYFNEGEMVFFVYTYTFSDGVTPAIYTFYNADGTKDVTRTVGGWYTPALDLLTEAEAAEYLSKYSATIEATVEY